MLVIVYKNLILWKYVVVQIDRTILEKAWFCHVKLKCLTD